MRLRSLGDTFLFLPKSGLKASDGARDEKFPFFTSSQNQKWWTNQPHYDCEALVFGTGGDASVHHITGPFSASSDCLVVTPKSGNYLSRYYFHYLQTNIQLIRSGFRGAGLKHVSKRYLEEILIPDVSRADQERVIEILDKSDSIKKKRSKAAKLADDLVRSAFLELLHELPDTRVAIKEFISDTPNAIRTGPFGSQLLHSEFTDRGVPVLGIDNVVTNRFRWAERRYISVEKYNELRRYRVFPGDVMITIMGTTGRVCIAPENLPESISTKHLCTITLDQKQLLSEYLWASLLWDPAVRIQASREGKGAIMEGWNMGIVRGLMIKRPTISEQARFAAAVRKADVFRIKLQGAERQADELFRSLAHRAFNGEL